MALRTMMSRQALPLSTILACSVPQSALRRTTLRSGSVARITVLRLHSSGAGLSRFDHSKHREDLEGNSLQSVAAGRRNSRNFLAMASSSPAASQTLSAEEEEVEYKTQEQIISHQRVASKLSHLEESRTLLNCASSGILSAISKKDEGFPIASMVTYAANEDGSIILSISSLSPHTRDLEANPKCSLLVPRDPSDRSDTVITMIGEALTVSEQDQEAVRSVYLKKHPDAFWVIYQRVAKRSTVFSFDSQFHHPVGFLVKTQLQVDFGDFRFVRIEPKRVRYVSGIATGVAATAEFSGQEFKSASVDPISQFAAPIAGHMNRDHADQTREIVEHCVGIKVESALIQQVDRFGFDVVTKRNGKSLKLRIPFPRPAEDRKDVKALIVEMLTASSPLEK